LGLLESGLVLGGYVFAMWCGGWRPGQPMPAAGPIYLAATTMTLAGTVACQAGNVLSCRSSTQPIWRLGLTTNPMVLAGIGLELLASRAHLHRSLARIFSLEPLQARQWIVLATFGPLMIAFEGTRKAITRRMGRRRLASAPA
jgi:magnesium-transporting ATPase (P-type)